MNRRWLFPLSSLGIIFISYLFAFYVVPDSLFDLQPALSFGVPLLGGPLLVSALSYYYTSSISTSFLIGLTPAVAALIYLVGLSLTPEGIVGDGPIWLILFVFLGIGMVTVGIGSLLGAGVRMAWIPGKAL